ncbi:MAG: hypothetical protein VKL59_19080 [Nostocaceae cyanobacterium]|nr:hypothetical protein [Nostocaceae cyanobacterium]
MALGAEQCSHVLPLQRSVLHPPGKYYKIHSQRGNIQASVNMWLITNS